MAMMLLAAGADAHALDEEYRGTPADWARYSHGVSHNPKCLELADWLDGLEPGDGQGTSQKQ